MKVIKKDGRTQKFDLDKIKTSIYRASDDAEQPLNESDIDNIAGDIETNIKDLKKDSVNSYVIQELVVDQLEKSGFNVLAKYYNLGNLE
ncbi:ATP cone domain-containing protein [Clostridium lacusfryxellense]|uniref:ATP cone domain-containing protein n=1 Tax=Clostridium lacusfryxellense TaxID=205328 RepID=UPI001C0CB9F1|nr:ATP cone domain-containing protein [Clostridium lacusfryxellense]MBU3112608.1 ATPase [Clostridium lacusfryxellense]